MANVSSPYGLIPVAKVGQGYYTNGVTRYFMPTNSSAGIFTGDIVTLNSGSVARGAATPTTTLSSNSPQGIMAGCKYVDLNGLTQEAAYVPAGAVTAGYTNIEVYVSDDPWILMKVQADGTVAASNIGLNAQLGNFTAPTVTAGANPISAIQLVSGTIGTTNTYAVRIVDVLDPTGLYSDCIVAWNFGVHRFMLSLAE